MDGIGWSLTSNVLVTVKKARLEIREIQKVNNSLLRQQKKLLRLIRHHNQTCNHRKD